MGDLFGYFSPTSFTFEGVLSAASLHAPASDLDLPYISLAATGRWTRLEDLSFVNAFTSDPLYISDFLLGGCSPPVRLLFDVSQLEGIAGDEGWIGSILDDLGGEDENYTVPKEVGEQALSRIKEVEVVVGSEEIKSFLLRGLKGSSLLERTKVVVRAQA